MASPDFLLLARTAIDEALELTSGEKEQLLKLNKLQCKYIAQKLSWTREILQSVVEPAAAAGSDVHAFERYETALKKELYRVVTDALSLIKQGCGEQWLRAAIRQRSDKSLEDFAEICYDVQWCTSLFCRFSLQNVACSRRQDAILAPEDCDGRLDAFDLFKLETAAKQDREDLRSNLELLRHDHVCGDSCARSEAEECLAARFLKTTVPWPTAVAVVPAATTINLASLLWRVSPENLPIVRVLGKGGFGEVCETEWLGERYAKKVFRDTSFQIFKTEAAILAGLFHPNVVRIISWSKERRTDYSLVMHLMQDDLFHFLSPPPTDTESSDSDDDVSLSTAAATVVPSSIPNSAAVVVPLSLPVAVDLMLQVARGLKYLHRNNIVHRDVKSLNILVKPLTGVPELEYEEGYLSAKLADFGTTKTKNESTRRSRLTLDIGTTPWMAPEMFGIDRSTVQWPQIAHAFKTDVYSFALVCYEILTRKQPFEDVLRSELCNWITVRRERPELPERCPRRLASLIQRCWEHDPCDRPNFPEICTELRYIKGLLLTGDDTRVQKVVGLAGDDTRVQKVVGLAGDDTRVQKVVGQHSSVVTEQFEAQGPWGGQQTGTSFCDGLATGIKALNISFSEQQELIWSLCAEYDVCGQSRHSQVHGELGHAVEIEINFNHPLEYLQQVEGFYGLKPFYEPVDSNGRPGRQIIALTCITFHSNIRTYGPYGRNHEGDTPFKSDIGKIVGFWGRSGMCIDQLGVFMAKTS